MTRQLQSCQKFRSSILPSFTKESYNIPKHKVGGNFRWLPAFFGNPAYTWCEPTVMKSQWKHTLKKSLISICITILGYNAYLLRGALGGSEHRNTAEKIAKYRYTTILCRNSMSYCNRYIVHLIHLEQITRKQKLRFRNVWFRQNKQKGNIQ